MMNRLQLFFCLLLLPLVHLSFGQDRNYPANYFRSPLAIPLYLSGTFGELRSNHFHAGIDIKTQGKEGLNVLAVASGYISRIKISRGGYGKAIYITHPNGYVSVYGHLQKFSDSLQAFVRREQYKNESFEIEIFPQKDEWVVYKGELIAYSGNTGGSEAPHLHFEIREEDSQFPVNPLFFKGIDVKDFYRPKITYLAIYPVDNNTLINGKNDTLVYPVEGWGQIHRLVGNPPIEVSGRVSFGLASYDLMNEIANHNGIFNIELLLDTSVIFSLSMEKISFGTTRYINSLIDYPYYKLEKQRLIRSQIDTNNLLFNYENVVNNGIVDFNDSLMHPLTYSVKDVYGNISSLPFKIQSVIGDKSPKPVERDEKKEGLFFDFRLAHNYTASGISLVFAPMSLYRSIYFSFSMDQGGDSLYAPIYHIHNRFTALQKSYHLAITPDSVPDSLKTKLYITYIDKKGGSYYVGGEWKDGSLLCKTNLFGDYSVMVDSIPPKIRPLNFGSDKPLQQTLKVSIKDEQTGIKKYRATLNNQWILMEYDPKNNLLVYEADECLKKGLNAFRLQVWDQLNNKSVYEAQLKY